MRKFSIFLLCLLMAAGCKQVDDTLKKVSIDDLEVTDVNIVVPSSGRTESTIVTTSYPWSVEGTDGWCKVLTRSGSAGTSTILFEVEPNETYEDRSANFTIVSGEKRTVVEVWQKQMDAVLFDRQIFDNIRMEGDEIAVNVAANIDYRVWVEESAQKWITQLSGTTPAPGEDPLVGSTVRFRIGKTEEWNGREGKIYFIKKDDDRVYEAVTVFQVQHDWVVLNRTYIRASMEGQQGIEVTLRSNVDYSAKVVDAGNHSWLTVEPSSRANVYLLNVAPYPDPEGAPEGDLRNAFVEFADVNSGGYAKSTVEVSQINGELIYFLGTLERELPVEGGEVELIAEENLDAFELVIPNYAKSWISIVPADGGGGGTRAPMLHHVFKLKVDENPSDMAPRMAEVYVRGRSPLDPNEVMESERITIRQDGRLVFDNYVDLLTKLQLDMDFKHNNWPIMVDGKPNANPTFTGFTVSGGRVTGMNLFSTTAVEMKKPILPEYIGDLKDLTTITIGANIKGPLPKSIGALPNLTTLTINNSRRSDNGGGGFDKIPAEWGQLHKTLKSLTISHNFTDSLTAGVTTPGDILDWVGDLESLTTLTVNTTNYNCPMPESWKNLKKLTSLTINGTGFTDVEALAGMESLTTLSFTNIPITDLPDLSKLTQLKTVTLANCAGITKVPQSLLRVASLTSLTISTPKVARIDDVDWSALVNLQTLSIAGTSSARGPMVGNLAPSMSDLTALKTLTLNYNNLSGDLVDIFAGKSLTSINLSNNPELTGAIPASLGNSPLSTFNIDYTKISRVEDGALASFNNTQLNIRNTSLESFPSDIVTNTRITTINLNDNQISESIPAGLSNRTNLVSINFSNNRIAGSIPNISNWTGVTSLNLSNNQIGGKLPVGIGSLAKILTLDLSFNQIEGAIPAEIEKLGSGITDALTVLYLNDNKLSGNLPAGFNRMYGTPVVGVKNGNRSIYLQNNQLTGPLPDMSHMILYNIDLRNNNFSGAVTVGILGGTGTSAYGNIYSFGRSGAELIPRDICVLFLSGNQLTGVIPGDLKTWILGRERANYTSPAQNWRTNILPQQGGKSLTME